MAAASAEGLAGGPNARVSRWSAFETVRIDGYDDTGDIYFFAAQRNPVHNGSIVAVFPLVHRLHACLAIAASLDGVRWSRVTPLLSCRLYGERTMDQPASPSLIRRGAELWLYVQEEVPGVTVDRLTPMITHTQLLKSEKPSRVVRYAFPCLLLARWTEGALRRLGKSDASSHLRPPFVHSCPPADETIQQQPQAKRGGDAKSCSWGARGEGGAARLRSEGT